MVFSSKRKVWTKAETVLFLSCYRGRKDEFDHPRKKKTAYAHVLEDMVYQGFEVTTILYGNISQIKFVFLQDRSVTVMSLEAKMRTLLAAYKYAKDNASRTGACPCPAPYMDEIDELFGNKAIISHAHSLDVGLRTNAVPLPQQNILGMFIKL